MLGSYPSSYLFLKFFHKKNILLEGDGNVGGTNSFYITKSLKTYLLVIVFDLGKAVAAGLLSYYLLNDLWLATLVSGVFSTLGHNYSLFLRFKGGKGASTNIGTFLLINPVIAIFFALSIGFVFLSNKYLKYTRNEFVEMLVRIVMVIVFVYFFKPDYALHALLFQLTSIIKYATEKQFFKPAKSNN